MIASLAVNRRGFIKVDEVDGRSPVERAAATSCTVYQICADTSPQAVNDSGLTARRERMIP
jgi:hypothetical protein